MAKLGTAFTPITNPAGARLLTLIDEVTGLRYKISIDNFMSNTDGYAFLEAAFGGGNPIADIPISVEQFNDVIGINIFGHASNGVAPMLQVATNDNQGVTGLLAKFRSGGTDRCTIDQNGDIKNVNNAYGAISDIKYKEKISEAHSQWQDIKAVKLKNYVLKEDKTNLIQLGVIAQDLEADGMGGLVSESQDKTKGVKYSVLYLKAIGALQEAMQRIEVLESKIK